MPACARSVLLPGSDAMAQPADSLGSLGRMLVFAGMAMAACSTASKSTGPRSPPVVPASPRPAPEATTKLHPAAADPAHVTAPVPASAAIEAACNDYAAGYCETDDNDVYAEFEMLSASGQQRVLHECWADLRQASASDIETFMDCVGCNGNCIDARDCLGGDQTGVMRYTADCPSDDVD